MKNLDLHLRENQKNSELWRKKTILRKIYYQFYKDISEQLLINDHKITAEIGSGIGNIQEVIPHCIRTDIFQSNSVHETQNAYSLSWKDESVCNLILFDAFHHLRYPGMALSEFHRVLIPGGRVVLFEPCMSLLGLLVYGLLHPEPIAFKEKIIWNAPDQWNKNGADDYAAQGNAFRIFIKDDYSEQLTNWTVKKSQRFASISYVLSGGYSKPQMFPDFAYPLLEKVDMLCNALPAIFATRLLIVLEKK